MNPIIRDIERIPQDVRVSYSEQAVATVYEAAGKLGMVDRGIIARTKPFKLCGSALTVSCSGGDNLMIHLAITLAQPGDVLVINAGGFLDAGAWGEILTVAAQVRGVAGLIIDGSVRDIEPISRRGFPVFSRDVCIGATTKMMPGLINHPITLGGIHISPGDLVLGDFDGIVVVPRSRAESVLATSIERETKEAVILQRLEAGETTLDILGFSAAVRNLGLQTDLNG